MIPENGPNLTHDQLKTTLNEYRDLTADFAENHYEEHGELPDTHQFRDYIEEENGEIGLADYPFSVHKHLHLPTDGAQAVGDLGSAIRVLREQTIQVVMKHVRMGVERNLKKEDVIPESPEHAYPESD